MTFGGREQMTRDLANGDVDEETMDQYQESQEAFIDDLDEWGTIGYAHDSYERYTETESSSTESSDSSGDSSDSKDSSIPAGKWIANIATEPETADSSPDIDPRLLLLGAVAIAILLVGVSD